MSGNEVILAPGTRVGKYEIVALLGQGGMGAVYEAIHTELKKRVAIKTLHPEFSAHSEARQRFVREGEAASRVRHPHVVDVADVGVDGVIPYLVMELLEGEDLKHYLDRRGPLPLEETIDLLLPIIAAVAAGHEAGVIHRDLKPRNIFLALTLTGDHHPKVLDFGVSKVIDQEAKRVSLTGAAAMMGTVAYMAPEQAKGAKFVDGRADQYALGLVLYECLTNRRAHAGEDTITVLRVLAAGKIEPLSALRPDLPASAAQAVMRALRFEPDERFPSVSHLGLALLPHASARARASWTPVFERAAERFDESPSSVVIINDDRSNARIVHDGTSGVSGTTPLRAPAPENGSTLGHSAREIAAPAPEPKRSRGLTAAVLGGLVVVGGILAAIVLSRAPSPSPAPALAPPTEPAPAPAPAPPPPAPTTLSLDVATEPADAELWLDGVSVGRGRLQRTVARGEDHTLRVSAPGYETLMLPFRDVAPPARLVLARSKPPEARPSRKAQAVAAEPQKPGAQQPTPTTPSLGANQAPIIKE